MGSRLAQTFNGALQRYSMSLTAERLRAHAVVLVIALWAVSLFVLATPGPRDRNGIIKGVDFLQFYTAARLVAEGRTHELYQWPAFAAQLRAITGTEDVLFLSVYPPQLALLLAPLAKLSFLQALTVWTAVTVGAYAVLCGLILKSLPLLHPYRSTAWLAAFGFVPFQQLVLHGQVGVLVLAALTAGWQAMRRGHLFWAGVAFGSLAFKPQFGVAALLFAAVSLNARVLAGVIAGALVQIACVALILGVDPWFEYLGGVLPRLVADAEQFEPKPWDMHSLAGFFRLLMGRGTATHVAIGVVAAFVVLLVWRIWRHTRSSDVRFSVLVLAAALLNPHLYVYDLVVLVLPLAVLSAWTLQHQESARKVSLPAALHLLFWVPLLAPVAAFTRVQISTVCMLLVLACLSRVHRAEHTVEVEPSESYSVQ